VTAGHIRLPRFVEGHMTSLDDTDAVPPTYTGAIHAGGGTLVFMGQLCPLIPGLLPFIALTVVFLLPLVALALAGAVLAAPPYLVWRLVRG
jgi:hypothetical protein